jgi:hypothetical protein
MAIYWSTGIPFKIPYGTTLEFGIEGSKLTTDYEYGPRSDRPLFSNVPYRVELEMPLTDLTMEYLKNFYHTDLLDGVLPFYAPILDGTTISWRKCKILNPSLRVTAETHNRWMAPLTLEVRGDYTLISETIFWYIETWGPTVGPMIWETIDLVVNHLYPDAVNQFFAGIIETPEP